LNFIFVAPYFVQFNLKGFKDSLGMPRIFSDKLFKE
jgi:hypothetical protein